MLLLALDTSSAAVTVALHDGTAVLAESSTVDAMRHGELVAPAVARVFAAASRDRRDLTEIVVGVGPGPFTGLRVGIVTALTLGAVLDVPVRGVCSLDAVAFDVSSSVPFVVTGDARRKEVYWAMYDGGRRVSGPEVARPATLSSSVPTAGRGPAIYPEFFPVALPPEYPSAAALAAAYVAGVVEVLAPEPLYLRRPDAVEPVARKPVLPA